jgi:putative lipoprotein
VNELVLRLLLPAIIFISACASNEPRIDWSEAATYVYRCDGEDQVIVVTIAADRGHLFSRQASQPLRRQADSPAFTGDDVYYLPDRPADLAPGQTATITIRGKQLADCRNDPRAAVWEEAKLRGVSYRAIGQEPPWVLEIDRGKGLLLVTGYGENRHRFPYVEAVSDSSLGTSSFISHANGEQITITIRGRQCSDSMSGETFASEVEIEWRGDTLRGCGRALH